MATQCRISCQVCLIRMDVMHMNYHVNLKCNLKQWSFYSRKSLMQHTNGKTNIEQENEIQQIS